MIWYPEVARVLGDERPHGVIVGESPEGRMVPFGLVAALPLRYGDGTLYLLARDGRQFLAIVGNEYPSSIVEVPARLVDPLVSFLLGS